MKHFIYRTHNLINGKEYTGKHSTNNLDDGYYGSGKALGKAVEKYKLKNFAVEILSFHKTEEEAYLEEEYIIDEEYVWRDDTYNQKLGGTGSWFHTRGKVTVKDNKGNIFNVDKNDPRYLSGELKHRNIGEVTVKDIEDNIFNISINDLRYKSGELKHISKGSVTVKDKVGNILKVDQNDPRYKSGELTHIAKGTICVKDKAGNKFRVDQNDPRYKSGELVGVSKGVKYKNKEYKNKICPHCGKTGKGPNMTRYHFNKCKQFI